MQTAPFERRVLLNVVLVMEGVLLAVSTAWCFAANIVLAPYLMPNWRAAAIGLGAGTGLLVFSFSILGGVRLADREGEKKEGFFRSLKEIALDELAPMFKSLGFVDILLVSVVSGFCEEIFFRGVLQTQLNLIAASVIFGFFHAPTFKHVPYGIWALLAGLYFGWLMNFTGSLWAPIVAHAFNNFVVLLYFRYGLKEKKKSNGEEQEAKSQGAESQEAEPQGAELQEAESQEAESQEAESQEAELQEAESQEAELQEAESQEVPQKEEPQKEEEKQ